MFGLDVKSPNSIFTSEVDVVIMGILTDWEDAVEYLISKGFPVEYFSLKMDVLSRMLNKERCIIRKGYFSLSYSRAKKAIEYFSEKSHSVYSPIGDTLSVIFVKD